MCVGKREREKERRRERGREVRKERVRGNVKDMLWTPEKRPTDAIPKLK